MKNENRLSPENCNKAKCKSCIFGPAPIHLSKERQMEIEGYLAMMESSHICHTTNLTCYGALEFQAKILHAMNIISSPTVDAMLAAAKEALSKPQPKPKIRIRR